jgi:dephospho-CoA kinase
MPALQRWGGPQRRIGLTGGIATGKSTVAEWLADQGLPVLDADAYALEALAPGTEATAAVLSRYGNSVRAKDHGTAAAIDRTALGSIVFRHRDERLWLEGLVHPLVRKRFEAALQQSKHSDTVVLMIPLLFEAGLESLCSEIWMVDCEPEQQLQRLMKRNGLDEAAARARINAQWPLECKRRLADQLIDNRGAGGATLHEQLCALLGTSSNSCDQAHSHP